jgi:serine/threonine-protein kinase
VSDGPFDARLFPLLAHALQLRTEEVEPFLARECRGDGALAARVLELLADGSDPEPPDTQASPLLARLQRALRVPALRGSAAELRDVRELLGLLRTGVGTLERYDVRGEIGHGGMGVVDCVWDRTLHCELARKRLLPGTDDETAVVRFLREAHITAQLDHPGIVGVHELGYTHEGELYFTMDLVVGETLASLLEGPIELRRKVEILHRATQTAAFAHERGVVHRDISPRNIVAGDHGAVFLLDWGVSQTAGVLLGPTSTRSGEAGEVELTGGGFLGTLCYAAPERIGGTRRPVDPSDDVYALGAILYHALAGEPPYHGGAPRLTAAELRQRILAGPPAPLHRRGIPGELVAIAAKAMAVDPEQRHEDGAALAADLEAWLEGRPLALYRGDPVYRLQKWTQRHAALALSISIGLLLLFGAALGTLALVTHKNNRILAESQVAEASIGFLEELFDSANPMRLDAGDVRVRDLLDEGRRKLETEPLVPAARARLAKSLGLTYLLIGDPDSASGLIEEAHAWAVAHLGADDPARLDVHEDLAMLRSAQERFDEADALFQELQEDYERSVGASDSRSILTMARRANALASSGKMEESAALLAQAAERAQHELGPEDETTLLCERDYAGALHSAGKTREADELYGTVLPALERCLGPDHVDVALARHGMAAVRGALGDFVAAERLTLQELESLTRTCGANSPQVAAADNNLARLYQQLGRYAEARPIQERVLAVARVNFGDGHEHTLTALNNLGLTLTELGEYDAARSLLEEASRGREEVLGEESAPTAEALMNLGVNESKAENAEEAERYLRDALRRYTAALGEEHPKTVHCLNTLAAHLRNAGRFEDAEPLFLDCLAKQRAQRGDENLETWKTLMGLINLYRRSGELEQAELWAERLVRWTARDPAQHAAAQATEEQIRAALER